ncbi:sigma factor [Athalassotoga saccharophila]|uniref:sigma factor n=1 Tax=Athalassotoga saccharophila TaxID=1441386 RepID=UPI001379DA6D|nr:sigma factor [Athalassotoga saccharophila]
MVEMEKTVRAIVKKYAHSVKRDEFEDLCQTVWYLVLLSEKTYDKQKGMSPQSYAYYFADMKLRDHFDRQIKLPGTDGEFSLLRMKAISFEDTDQLPDTIEFTIEDEIPSAIKLKSEGYTLEEISKILKASMRKIRRTIKEYQRSI